MFDDNDVVGIALFADCIVCGGGARSGRDGGAIDDIHNSCGKLKPNRDRCDFLDLLYPY